MTTARGLLGCFLVFLAAMLGFAGVAEVNLGLLLVAGLLFLFGVWVGDLQNLLR